MSANTFSTILGWLVLLTPLILIPVALVSPKKSGIVVMNLFGGVIASSVLCYTFMIWEDSLYSSDTHDAYRFVLVFGGWIFVLIWNIALGLPIGIITFHLRTSPDRRALDEQALDCDRQS